MLKLKLTIKLIIKIIFNNFKIWIKKLKKIMIKNYYYNKNQ